MPRAGRHGEARERVVRAAITLFARHGVRGTSLQMIAGELGVTKAAVYRQFHTKEDIVLAVVRPILMEIGGLLKLAEREPSQAVRTDLALRGLVDVLVGHREIAAVFAVDPAILDVLRGDAELNDLVLRMGVLLHGPAPGPGARVAAAVVGAGLAAAAADPELSDIDDETLAAELLTCARRTVGQPSAVASG